MNVGMFNRMNLSQKVQNLLVWILWLPTSSDFDWHFLQETKSLFQEKMYHDWSSFCSSIQNNNVQDKPVLAKLPLSIDAGNSHIKASYYLIIFTILWWFPYWLLFHSKANCDPYCPTNSSQYWNQSTSFSFKAEHWKRSAMVHGSKN